jgi:amino acid transporter
VAKAHDKHETPHVAVAISSLLVLAPALVLSLRGAGDFDIYGWVGTVATIAFIFVYLAVLVAAPVYLKRHGELKVWHVVSAIIGVVFLINGLAGNFYPLPAAPYNWLSWLAVALVVAGAVWYWIRKASNPNLGDDIKQDLANIQDRFGN